MQPTTTQTVEAAAVEVLGLICQALGLDRAQQLRRLYPEARLPYTVARAEQAMGLSEALGALGVTLDRGVDAAGLAFAAGLVREAMAAQDRRLAAAEAADPEAVR